MPMLGSSPAWGLSARATASLRSAGSVPSHPGVRCAVPDQPPALIAPRDNVEEIGAKGPIAMRVLRGLDAPAPTTRDLVLAVPHRPTRAHDVHRAVNPVQNRDSTTQATSVLDLKDHV